jgi:hypothetical protein
MPIDHAIGTFGIREAGGRWYVYVNTAARARISPAFDNRADAEHSLKMALTGMSVALRVWSAHDQQPIEKM